MPTKPMTPAQAVKLANEAIDRWIQFDAIDANLFERYGRPFHGKTASERRKKLTEAKAVLAGMLDETERNQPYITSTAQKILDTTTWIDLKKKG